MMEDTGSPTRRPGRVFCFRCYKPDIVCVCADIQEVDTRFRLAILQHPREHRRTISTARIVSLSVRGCRLFVGVDFSRNEEFLAMLDPAKGPAYIVFPERGAPEAGELALAENGWPDASPLFVLIDGTWSQAKKLKNQNPILDTLPRVGLRSETPSQYKIRKQPKAGCLSTVEAAALLLSRLEARPFPGQPMLDCFNTMIDKMSSFKSSRPSRGVRLPAPRPPPPTPVD